MRAASNSLAKLDAWIGWLLKEAIAERRKLGGGGTGEVVIVPSFLTALVAFVLSPAPPHIVPSYSR